MAVCTAAGNENQDARKVYPANNADTITVSAIRQDGSFASDYSNYGTLVDFCAPGSEIVSAAPRGMWQSLSGTSMASPHMAAAVAYVKMVMPNATVGQVRQVLRNYAVDLGAPGKDSYYGYGAVRLKSLFENYTSVDISKFAVSLPDGSSYTYTGKARKPAVKVEGLSDLCYSVSYSNNVEPGTGTVTVTGKRNYTEIGRAHV